MILCLICISEKEFIPQLKFKIVGDRNLFDSSIRTFIVERIYEFVFVIVNMSPH